MFDFPPIQTRVAGVSFENRDGSLRQTYVRQVSKGDALVLRREPENPFDPHAMAVDWADADGRPHQLGYVPRSLAALLAPLVDGGQLKLKAKVARKGGGGLMLAGVRMVIELDAAAMPASAASGLEPAIAQALEADRLELLGGDPGLSPSLGGLRAHQPPTCA